GGDVVGGQVGEVVIVLAETVHDVYVMPRAGGVFTRAGRPAIRLLVGPTPVAYLAISRRRASETSPPVSMSRIRGMLGNSVATRRTASSSNDWMITGVVFSDSGFSR